MSKEEMMKTLTSLKGIGESKADALIAAGFDTTEKIKSASLEELTKVPGISDSVAESLIKQLKDNKDVSVKKEKVKSKPSSEKITEKKQIKKPEPKGKTIKKEIKKSSSDKKEGYVTKKKAELSDDIKKYLPIREELKKRTPHFYREEWFRYKKLGKSWRRPDGISSKMRRNFKYRPNRVRVGYRGPKKTRGLHPSGFQEIMVYNTNDLEAIDPKTQAARIGGAVGTRKRIEIEKKASELDIRILNKQR
ncbi:50S ribosomal protein L32e [Thermoplasmatales archaeon ex4572_165]|nr:MAG: 50S ribosomal protein L32e [Thermoplasmatales archaeon ex4572_165]RLF59689.1 MAG: 50S ribosomal protein L32e [Thermoplasmata archaeon]